MSASRPLVASSPCSTELDLLAAECPRGCVGRLSGPELAACVSALAYEARQPDDAAAPAPAGRRCPGCLGEMVRLGGARGA